MDSIALVRNHLAHHAASRWDDYKADLADTVVYEEVGTRYTVTGPEEYLSAIQRWKRAFPDLEATVLGIFLAGDRVLAEIDWTGTHTGPFEGPFGAIAPTGQRGSCRAALVYRIENGKIAEVHHYFDVLTVLLQMGVIPGLGTPVTAGKPAAAPPPPRS